jgi:RNA polymerase sigma factor (sigma-70 family)
MNKPDPRHPDTITRARSGEASAREAVARHTLQLALRTAAAITGDLDEARDIAQEIWIEVNRDLKHLRDPAAFDAWAHRIVVRRCARWMRSRRLQPWRSVAPSDLPEVASTSPGPQATAISREQGRGIALAMQQLPPRQRLAIALRYIHDLTEAQVANAMNCPEGTVASLLSRARAAMATSPYIAHGEPGQAEEGHR